MVRVSGTIRKAEEEVIRRSRGVVKRVRSWDRGGEGMLRAVERSVERGRREGVRAGEGEGGGESEGSE